MEIQLTELQYSTERKGTLRLYVFGAPGEGYLVRQFFAKHIRYPDEEIHAGKARVIADAAVRSGREVRITNGGDMLVFHAKGAEILYPPEGAEKFWESIL